MIDHPSISSMIQTPYGVVSSYIDPDGVTRKGAYASSVENTVPNFEYHYKNLLSNFLLRAAQNEQAKELAYINQMMSCFDEKLKNSILYRDFLEIYKSVTSLGAGASLQLSVLVDTIQKMKMGLYELDKVVKENHEIFKNINMSFLDRNIVEELRKVLRYEGSGSSFKMLDGFDINMTGEQIVSQVLNNVRNKMIAAVQSSKINKNSKDGQALINRYMESIDKIINLYSVKLKQFYTSKFSAIGEAENIQKMRVEDLNKATKKYDESVAKSKRIMISKKGKPKTIQQTIIDAIAGSLGGKSVEYTLDIRGGGINTGNISGEKGQSIDADNIQLGSGTADFYFDNPQNKDKFYQITDFNEFLEQAQRIEDFESKFMIMYSDKDQSVSKDFKNMVAHSDVKIKGDASLSARAPEIIQMYSLISESGSLDPTDLIFSIANLAEEFVCHGQVAKAKQTLGAICVGWMFDDVEQIITGSSLLKGASTIHFYNINNFYYTLSDVLYKTSQALNDAKVKNQSSYVKIGISVPKGSIYGTALTTESEGIPRWNSISSNLMENTKINIHMNPSNLYNALFSAIM